jgi:hypothetical protein
MAQPTWITAAGSIGSFPYGRSMRFVLKATPVRPATSLTYQILSGSLPTNLVLNTTNGVITGIPTLVSNDTTTTFTIRTTDNLNNIRDRTFSIIVTGTAIPNFTTPSGKLLTTNDSVWTQVQVMYSNPDPNNRIDVELQSGLLPPGLEVSTSGLIQGYPKPPLLLETFNQVITVGLSTKANTDYIYCLNVLGMTIGRQVVFGGNTLGGIEEGQTYFIKNIDFVNNAISISSTQNGSVLPLTDETGSMTVTLPETTQGTPTIRTYNFVLRILSLLGTATQSYSITVINQNLSRGKGGPGINTRAPTILNTRPLTIAPNDSDPYYGYYILPSVPTTTNASIGTFESNNYFAFKIIGYDFDGDELKYICSGLPNGITFNANTGWITGTITRTTPGINIYKFTAQVVKQDSTAIHSPVFNFQFKMMYGGLTDTVIWTTSDDLGTVYNSTASTLKVAAVADVDLSYRLVSGALPPNLTLLSNGEITGVVASQPTKKFLQIDSSTDFTFTIQAYSIKYNTITSNKTFKVTVYQKYNQPTDVLYIEAAPSISDRQLLETLLTDESLIPTELLYRADDVYFGKASSVIYDHAYGIYASDVQDYIAAVTKNHYWRNITLGELKTAIARNDAGEIIYEVVYSSIIDNLVNPQGVSVENEILWPRLIDLQLGPWYTSVTNIFTSYIELLNQKFYTSLSPGYANILYPNSLYNMRNRVAEVVGQVYDSTLLPKWMTSQQENGSTLGYTQAWVICYTKPGFAKTIKENIENNWGYVNPQGNFTHYTLNQINFNIDRFTVNKTITYNWDNNLNPPAWTGLPSASPVPSPLNSKDFYVLFPRETILPDKTQY